MVRSDDTNRHMQNRGHAYAAALCLLLPTIDYKWNNTASMNVYMNGIMIWSRNKEKNKACVYAVQYKQNETSDASSCIAKARINVCNDDGTSRNQQPRALCTCFLCVCIKYKWLGNECTMAKAPVEFNQLLTNNVFSTISIEKQVAKNEK